MAALQLPAIPGLSSATALSIPKDWSPSWFRSFIGNVLKNADTRNAIDGPGIAISGNITSPATIGLSAGYGIAGQVLTSQGSGKQPVWAAATGGLTVTDGTHTVTGATQVTFSGATVGGSTPNATVTITGGGGSLVIYSDLLLHMDTVVDNGRWAFSPALTGSATLSTAQKKFGTASLLPVANGGMHIPNNSMFGNLGSSDWSFDFWIYPTSLPSGEHSIFGCWTSANGLSYFCSFNGTNGVVFYFDASFPVFLSGGISKFTINNWYHIAIAKWGTSIFCWLNGVAYGAPISCPGITTVNNVDGLVIGYDQGAADFFPGYIDEFRFVHYDPQFVQAFTPPTSPYTQ